MQGIDLVRLATDQRHHPPITEDDVARDTNDSGESGSINRIHGRSVVREIRTT